MGSSADRKFTTITQTVMPAPVHFRGAPAVRFWEMEDARVDYALMPVGPTDLAHLLLIEYASSYGNDWYLVPLDLPVGSLTRMRSLVVTDTFGMRTLHRPIGDRALPAPNWSMFQLAHTARHEPRRAEQPAVPGAGARHPARKPGARGSAVHARRDGQHGLGHRARDRKPARAAAES